VLQYLVQHQCPIPSNLSHYAARSGSISTFNWLRAESLCVFDEDTCAGAALGGHLAALQHLRSEGCDWSAAGIAYEAARGGSIAVVEWLRQQQGVEFNAEMLAGAARSGIAMCEHLRSAGCDWHSDAPFQAALSADVGTLRWLRERGCPWNIREICYWVARFGHTAILDYVLAQEGVLDAEVLTRALDGAGLEGQLQTAQRLRQHGAEWPAVLQWRRSTIRWAREQGCTSPTA
jgi:hypothetical protein